MRRALTFLSICMALAGVSLQQTYSDSGLNTVTDRCKAFMAANPDLVCLPLATARALDVRIATLDHDLSLAKLKAQRLGLTLGCGPTVSGFVTDSWSTKALPAVSCGLVYGWRF